MGRLREFEIVLADVDFFKAGALVEGYLKIVLSKPKENIRGVILIYEGKAKTKWEETDDNSDVEEYYMKEKYFGKKIIILGKDKEVCNVYDKIRLEAGEHKFPFRFQIPTRPLPHPIEGEYGRVRYTLTAIIDRPWKLFDHVTKRYFSISGAAIDLDTISDASEPSSAEDIDTVCCCCCESGPIKVTAETNQRGYVPGESIWVSGLVDNQSSRDICSITVKMIQTVTFSAKLKGEYGKCHYKNVMRTLAKEKVDIYNCGEGQTVSYKRPIIVPSCPPTGLPGCSIIDVEYVVEFAVDISGTPIDTIVTLPIIIGTVPLSSSYRSYPQNGVITQQPTASPNRPLPPSYELATGGVHAIPSKSGYEHTFGQLMYAPRYPVYHFDQPLMGPSSSKDLRPSQSSPGRLSYQLSTPPMCQHLAQDDDQVHQPFPRGAVEYLPCKDKPPVYQPPPKGDPVHQPLPKADPGCSALPPPHGNPPDYQPSPKGDPVHQPLPKTDPGCSAPPPPQGNSPDYQPPPKGDSVHQPLPKGGPFQARGAVEYPPPKGNPPNYQSPPQGDPRCLPHPQDNPSVHQPHPRDDAESPPPPYHI